VDRRSSVNDFDRQGTRLQCYGITIKEQLGRYRAEILRLRCALDVAFARGARSSAAREEDRVIFLLGVACRDLFEEVLFAVSEGFGRSALRSVRTMYECVVFSHFLRLHPEKTDDYLATFHAQWAKVLRDLPDAAREMPEVHKDVALKVPAYAKGKTVNLDWSDKTTKKMAQEAGITTDFHAWSFSYTSGFVHPSGMFLMRHLSAGPGVIEVSTAGQDEESLFALRISHILIMNAANLRLKYATSSELKESLAECRKDFVKIWGYEPPI